MVLYLNVYQKYKSELKVQLSLSKFRNSIFDLSLFDTSNSGSLEAVNFKRTQVENKKFEKTIPEF